MKTTKRLLTVLLYLVSSLLPYQATANVSTTNAEGILITFIGPEGARASTSPAVKTTRHSSLQSIINKAMSLKGIKYRYGGSTPDTGFDCSGFVNYVFKKAANVKLPRTTRGLSRTGASINKQSLQAGDLVFFNTRKRAFSHVGIYIGNGDFIHAPRTGRTISIGSIKTGYWKRRYDGARRVN